MMNLGWLTVLVCSGLAIAGESAACMAQDDLSPGPLQRVLAKLHAKGPDWARDTAQWLTERDFVAHMMFMATDPRGGTGGGGFYKPSISRYDWNWLAKRFDDDGDGAVTVAEFDGPRAWFDILDKSRNESLTQEDFDWFGDSPLAKASAGVKGLFNQVDGDGNGQVTPAEWKRWFDGLSAGKDYLSQDDLLPLLMNTGRAGSKSSGGKSTGTTPGKSSPFGKALTFENRLPVICSYISGDVGSLSEGPALNAPAPYFTLATLDGQKKLALSDHRGYKPLVLMFGSFT